MTASPSASTLATAAPQAPPLVNDFSIQVATANGSGSQSSNTVLLRAIFQMGVPVSGKNLFPSNIAGLPTWYTIRASRDGWIGRKKEIDLLVAMNPDSARDDVAALRPGSAVVYDAPLALSALRDDLVFYAVPFDAVVAPVSSEPKLRRLLRNMAYVGVLARLLSIDLREVELAIAKVFPGKAKARDLSVGGIGLLCAPRGEKPVEIAADARLRASSSFHSPRRAVKPSSCRYTVSSKILHLVYGA